MSERKQKSSVIACARSVVLCTCFLIEPVSRNDDFARQMFPLLTLPHANVSMQTRYSIGVLKKSTKILKR